MGKNLKLTEAGYPSKGPGSKPSIDQVAKQKDQVKERIKESLPDFKDPSAAKQQIWLVVIAVIATLILVKVAVKNGWFK